ncbi:MAG: magnesium transporter MgtC [Acidobacteria bacterium]|nr:MAG: magnesium transporter MgtC [Acidobacteriota bacterium]
MQPLPHISQPEWKHVVFLSSSIARLLLAAVLGGLIGLERSIRRKSAGIRTNMFICMGAALFTILSDIIPDPSIGDRTRIASNIVQGVGFLGAGAILHAKGGVSGLTTAATIWVVASIGIAAGAGHYLLATFATVIILVALLLLGSIEAKLGLKRIAMSYEIKGESAPKILDEINELLEDRRLFMQGLQVGRSQNLSRVIFSVTCTLPEHEKLQADLKMRSNFESVSTFNAVLEE